MYKLKMVTRTISHSCPRIPDSTQKHERSQGLLQCYGPLRSSFTKLVSVKVTSVFTYPYSDSNQVFCFLLGAAILLHFPRVL